MAAFKNTGAFHHCAKTGLTGLLGKTIQRVFVFEFGEIG